ncbi:MAG: [citrate (pro-3S)-lyase] ligase [Synergistaceae bacterium]|jgi:[citrate (pro-3S)-lyase] ligase|nr:[citrate (pro-3S)-lyase] ligase [Synergistaceae bacterium]
MYSERILVSPWELAQRAELLASRGLSVPGGGSSESDVILGIFQDFPDDERLVATGSLIGHTLQGAAVREELEGQGLTSEVLTLLLRHAADSGIWHLFLFTRPREVSRFAGLGFRPVAATDAAALLEWGRPGIEEFLENLRASVGGSPVPRPGPAALVVNCNPFTLGHRYLVEKAAAARERLYVLVVREDRSEFPFEVRFRLVTEGVSDLKNVTVLSGGEYCVSVATFPSYFTGEEEFASVYAALDLTLFAARVAPALSVKKRFVGTEPFSPVTHVYNETMKALLPRYGIEVEELKRLELVGGPVSASRVRALLRQGRMEEAKTLVPSSTRRWLASSEAAQVLERLR